MSTERPLREDTGSWLDEVDVRFLQPYQATKAYLCPGCNRELPAGTGHLVVVPRTAPDLRRHWHRACWERELRRKNGRDGGAWW